MEMKEEEFDRQIRKWIQSDALTEAPKGFSGVVMDKVMKEKLKAIRSEPVISVKQWGIVAACFLSLLGYIFFGNLQISDSWEQYFSIDMISVSLSRTFVYSLLVFTVFLFLQIYFIRNKIEQFYQ